MPPTQQGECIVTESKTIKIQAVNRIEGGGKVYNPGDRFECEKTEALRLINLGAAKLPDPEIPVEAKGGRADDLLSKIAAAKTYEEVLSLMPDQEPEPEVAEAFEAKLAELKGDDTE
jgi:hypothetical protein